MTNIFERSSKQKIRFASEKGFLATEDLWELSLPSLDVIAKKVNAELKNSEEESFISESSVANTELNLKMDVLKHIIKYKLDLKEAAEEYILMNKPCLSINEIKAMSTISPTYLKNLREFVKSKL